MISPVMNARPMPVSAGRLLMMTVGNRPHLTFTDG
jgi:hypothetical protein